MPYNAILKMAKRTKPRQTTVIDVISIIVFVVVIIIIVIWKCNSLLGKAVNREHWFLYNLFQIVGRIHTSKCSIGWNDPRQCIAILVQKHSPSTLFPMK